MVRLDEYGIDRAGNWLQLFANGKGNPDGLVIDDPDDDDLEDEDIDTDDDDDIEDDLDDDTSDDDDTSEDDQDDDDGDTDGDDGTPGKKGDPKAKGDDDPEEKLIPQSKVQAQIKDRLARQAKSFTTKIKTLEAELDKVKGQTLDDIQAKAGVSMDADEVVKAVQFWAYLQANPRHSAAWNAFLQANPWEHKPEFKPRSKQVDPEDLEAKLEAKLEYRETLRDLRSDPIFKKYESRIREYAEDEGFDITTARGLKQAFKAWRGENLRLIAANARREGQRDAKVSKEKAKKAALTKASGGRGSVKGDVSKMSDMEFLRKQGIPLFTDD